MGKKNWNERWGGEANEMIGLRARNVERGLTNGKYIRCIETGGQCLRLDSRLFQAVRTRILLGIKEFELTGFSSIPNAMVIGLPVTAAYIEDNAFIAHYKGRGKWLITVG